MKNFNLQGLGPTPTEQEKYRAEHGDSDEDRARRVQEYIEEEGLLGPDASPIARAFIEAQVEANFGYNVDHVIVPGRQGK